MVDQTSISTSQAWATILADSYRRLGDEPTQPFRERDQECEEEHEVWIFEIESGHEVTVDGRNVTYFRRGEFLESPMHQLSTDLESHISEESMLNPADIDGIQSMVP